MVVGWERVNVYSVLDTVVALVFTRAVAPRSAGFSRESSVAVSDCHGMILIAVEIVSQVVNLGVCNLNVCGVGKPAGTLTVIFGC